MIRLVPIASVVLLAAGTCSGPDGEPEASQSATQTASQQGPQTGKVGEIENINEHLGDLKKGVQKKADDRTKAIDEKIERGNQ